jgi:hypothetical protein
MKIGHENLVADFVVRFLNYCYGLMTAPLRFLVVPQL